MIQPVRLLTAAYVVASVSLCVSCGSHQSSSGPSSHASGASGGNYVICFSSPNARVVSLSAAFPVKPATQVEALEEPWAKDFRRYIAQSNGREEGSSVTCTPVDSSNPQAAVKDKAESLRKEGHEVVETRWVYAGR